MMIVQSYCIALLYQTEQNIKMPSNLFLKELDCSEIRGLINISIFSNVSNEVWMWTKANLAYGLVSYR